MASYSGAAPATGGNGGVLGNESSAAAVAAAKAHDSHGGHGAHGGEFHIHHPAASVYWIVFGLLMVLLLITVGAYLVDLQEFVPIPGINLIVALIIAITKAALVVLYFMNVKGSTKLTWLWAGLGFVWLLIMAGVFIDYQSRGDLPGWQ
jgi:cytochrome c oxidase subunit 4